MSQDRKTREEQSMWPGKVRDLAGRLSGHALRDPRVQDVTSSWRHQVEQVRGQVHERAEQRLEELIEQKRQARGTEVPAEVEEVLAERRREREQRAEELRWRAAVLTQARTLPEKQVLMRVLETSSLPELSRQVATPRYTTLLDSLVPDGDAEREMAIHRALWSLAERRVLAVSSHGEITVTFMSPATQTSTM